MTSYRFADGTIVHQDFRVEGDSAFAVEVSEDLAPANRGRVVVPLRPPPGGDVPLDPAEPATLDAYLRMVARVRGIALEQAPEVEYPPDPREYQFVPGRVY